MPIFLIFFFFACNPSGNIRVLTTNDGITLLLIDGPETEELHENNPFLDYRLNVTFTKGERSIVVPGFYAADGNAGIPLQFRVISGKFYLMHLKMGCGIMK